MDDPSTNGGNGGRDARGRFVKGNLGGPENPKARDVARLREVFRSAVPDSDIRALAKRLVAMGKRGNVFAAREVLDRVLGKSAIVLDQSAENDSVLPVIEVVVENREEFLEFNQIREAMIAQAGNSYPRAPLVGLPAPAEDE